MAPSGVNANNPRPSRTVAFRTFAFVWCTENEAHRPFEQ